MSVQTKVEKHDQTKAEKREWDKPCVHRFDARDAESSHGAIADGGGGFQGS